MKKPTRPQISIPDLPFRTAYSPHLKIAINFPAQGRTKQSFKDECDINVIMSRYQATGQLPDNLNPTAPQYIDATGFDFDLAMNLVAEASSAFQELPSAIRSRFNNDPGAFLDFVHDPNNRSEMAQMGLLKPEAEWSKGAVAPTPSESPKPPSNPSTNDSRSTTGVPGGVPGGQ